MKYLDEFRDPAAAKTLVDAITRRATRTWTVMEVCGGQTHSIIRNGIDQLLAGAVEFIHGPGCPVVGPRGPGHRHRSGVQGQCHAYRRAHRAVRGKVPEALGQPRPQVRTLGGSHVWEPVGVELP